MITIPKKYINALSDYKYIDLFCGIGGFHLALKSFGAKCEFASDIDAEARQIYSENFKITPYGDIKEIKNEDIPEHDILCAGFPCQSFSISGNQEGFNNEKTGKLFFEIIRIANHCKPKIILLENVANLEKHDNGKTLNKIINSLKKIGYRTYERVLCASDYNVPQVRRRLYIVAFRNDLFVNTFEYPKPIKLTKKLKTIMEENSDTTMQCEIKRPFTLRENFEDLEINAKKPYIRIGEIGLGRQGERIYSPEGCAVTLSSRSGGLGGRTGIYLVDDKIRKLTPRECARLMGFPDSYKIAKTNNMAYQQFGNSIVVNVLQKIIIQVIKAIQEAEINE